MTATTKGLALAAAALLWAGGALAQGYGKVQQPWFPQGKIAGGVGVSTSSAATALPATGLVAWVCNTGSNDAYLQFGTDNTVTAAQSRSSWLKAGTCSSYDLFPFAAQLKFVAAVTASSTTTLAVETGLGSGPSQGSGGGGGGPTSNVAVTNFNPNGAATSANSAPVVLATDQAAVPVGKASATGGAGGTSTIAPATPAGQLAKNAAATLYAVVAGSTNATGVWLKLYDTAATPTCGSGTPAMRILIPSNATAANGGGNTIPIGAAGRAFTAGIGWCVTGLLADADTTAIGANAVAVNLVFQ